MSQYGIPVSDLGFTPLETSVTGKFGKGAAGLVSVPS